MRIHVIGAIKHGGINMREMREEIFENCTGTVEIFSPTTPKCKYVAMANAAPSQDTDSRPDEMSEYRTSQRLFRKHVMKDSLDCYTSRRM